MSIALENVLAKAGLKVDANEFLNLVEDAARRLTPPNPDPSHYFSADQRAALTDVGLDLSPVTRTSRTSAPARSPRTPFSPIPR